MTTDTTTQTPATPATEVDVKAQLESAVTAASAALSEEQTRVNGLVAAEMAAAQAETRMADFASIMADNKVTALTAALAKAKSALSEYTRTSRWENSAALRKPLEDALSAFVKGKPTVAVKRVFGTLTLTREAVEVPAPDGSPEGTPPTMEARDVLGGKLNVTLDNIDPQTLIDTFGANVDVSALMAQDITNISVDVDMTRTPATITIKPASAGTVVTSSERRASGEPGKGAWVYPYGGKELSSSDFLDTLKAEGSTFYKDHASALGWNVGGNGRANLAETAAKSLGIERFRKE